MKKDKAWLKQKLNTEKYHRGTNELKTKTTYGELYDRGVSDGINVALEFIEQLDEPEVKQLDKKIKELDSYNDELIRDNNQLRNELDNQEVLSQGWIEEHKYNHYIGRPFVYVDDLQNLLVPKQEKPVIPQFVVDWIESYRKKTLVELITDAVYSPYEDSKRFRRWFHEEMGFESNYSEFLSRVWLNGYEVEEQKYQVIIRDGEYIRLYLCKYGDNVMIGTNDNYIEKCPEVTYLTEQEIKAVDERYWAFAEEVTK